jgi:uracil-DNA glycosylase family 4
MNNLGRCSACPGKFHVIPGDPYYPCRVLCIGQNPGKSEEASAQRDEYGMVFIGDAGKETNQHFLLLAGLTRGEDVAFTNAMKCHTDNDRKPSPKEVAACAAHFLPEEIERYNPEIIVMLGGTALSLVPGLIIETHRGYPFKRNLFGKDRWIFVTQHPAAGLHDTMRMLNSIEDFERLREVLGGNFSVPVDEYPSTDYRDLTGNHEELHYILKNELAIGGSLPLMARDTEYLQPKNSPIKTPWCSTWTATPGTGYMIRATDSDGLKILGSYMPQFSSILHNALADLDVEEAMGLPYCDFQDTMQLASHQGGLPQKLKALAWRLAGMTMKDYEDVVMPYSRVAVMEWLEHAYDIAVLTPTTKTKYTKKKRKVPKTEKAMQKLWAEIGAFNPEEGANGYFYFKIAEEEVCDSDLTKKVLHIHAHTAKPVPQDGVPYNPWESWQKQVVEKLGPEVEHEIVKRIGPMPQASIAEVYKRDKMAAVTYAARDSDATRRIYPVLKDRSHKYDGRVMLGDIDR